MDQGNSWTDSHGRQWHAAITVSALKRVKDLVAVDLLDVFDGHLPKAQTRRRRDTWWVKAKTCRGTSWSAGGSSGVVV